MTDSREVSIKFTVETAGGVAKVKNMVAAVKKAGESVKKTGKESTAAGKKFGKASRSMQSAAQRTEKKMRKLRASLGVIKESLRSLAQAARRTAAVMIGGAAAVTAVYSRFERAMIRTTAVAVGGEKGFSNAFRSMSKEAMKVANTTEHTAKQVGEGMEFMAMAGLKPAQIIAATAATADLASAANIRMADAANIATNVMTGFGMKAEELGRVNNVLTGTFTNSNVNIMQLGESFKVVGANASVLGISIEEVSTALGLLGNVGIQGTEAGTGLKRALSAIVKPSGQAAEAMSRLGLNTKVLTDGSKNMRGGLLRMLAILQGTQKAYKEAGKTTEFLADMFMLFGERAGPKMAAMLKQGTDAFIDLQLAAKNAVSADVTKWIAEIQRESVKGKFDILVSNIESAAVAIGGSLAPAAKSLIDTMKDLAESVASLSGDQLRVIAGFLKAAVVIAAITSVVLALAAAVATAKFAWIGLGGAAAFAGVKSAVAAAALFKLQVSTFGLSLAVSTLNIGFAALFIKLTVFAALVAGLVSLISRNKGATVDWAHAWNNLGESIDAVTEIYLGNFYRTTNQTMDALDGLIEKTRIMKALSAGGFLGGGGALDAMSNADRETLKALIEMKKVKGHIAFDTASDLSNIRQMKGSPVGLKDITATLKSIKQVSPELDGDGLKTIVASLAAARKSLDGTAVAATKYYDGLRSRAQEIASKQKDNASVQRALAIYIALTSSREMAVRVKIRNLLDQISDREKEALKLSAEKEKAEAERLAKIGQLNKKLNSFLDSLIKKTNQMKVKLISGFDPGAGAGAQAGNTLVDDIAAFNKGLRKAEIGTNTLTSKFGIVSDYASTLARRTLDQAGSSLAASFGTKEFDENLSKAADHLVPAFERAHESMKNLTSAFSGGKDEVVAALKVYAFAHADIASKLKKATQDRIKAESNYISSMKSFADMQQQLTNDIQKMESLSPAATEAVQQKTARDESIDEIRDSAIKASNAILKAAIKEEELKALREKQIDVQKTLVSATGILTSSIGTLIQALAKDNPVLQEKGAAIEAGGLSFVKMAGSIDDAVVSRETLTKLNYAHGKRVGNINREHAEAVRLSTQAHALHAKEIMETPRTAKELESAMNELGQHKLDDPTILLPDFTNLEDGLYKAALAGFGKIHDIEIEDGKLVAKSLIIPGLKSGKVGIQAFVDAAKLGAEKISSLSQQGNTGVGGLIGGAVGSAIGGIFGPKGSPIGKMVGEFIGNILETIIMALPGMIMKAAQIAYGLIEKAVGAVKKVVKVVPEQRFQGGVEFGSKFIAPVLAAMTPVIAALAAFGAAVAFAASPLMFIIPTIEGIKTIGGLLQFSVIPALMAMGAALAAFLLFIGTQEIKFDKVLGAPDTDEEAVDAPERTAFKKIMDGLSASIDRVVLAMNPFYEKLFVLVGLFDYVMQAFIIFSQALTGADFEESLFAVFKRLTLGIIDTVIAIARLHNMFVMLSRVSASWGMIIPPATVGTLSLTKAFGNAIRALGEWINSIPGLDGQGNWAVNTGTDMMESATDELGKDFQGMVDEIGALLLDLGSYIDIGELETLRDNLASKSFSDILGRSMDLIGMGDESGTGKEFGEQLTNVPSGFKVNLARFKAMDADGEGGAVDMGGGRSIMDIDATDFFGRMTQAVRAGTAESLGSLVNAIGSLDDVIRPDNWEDIFGHPLDRMSNELGNAFDSLTNTLGLALLGPEEAFQGGGGMGAAMGGRQAGGNITSGNNTMNININELSIADAANPDQLANMIAERSTRNQMAQAGTPFPSHQSGSGWWGGNEGGGGRS